LVTKLMDQLEKCEPEAVLPRSDQEHLASG
jgi:hypothetical protein